MKQLGLIALVALLMFGYIKMMVSDRPDTQDKIIGTVIFGAFFAAAFIWMYLDEKRK